MNIGMSRWALALVVWFFAAGCGSSEPAGSGGTSSGGSSGADAGADSGADSGAVPQSLQLECQHYREGACGQCMATSCAELLNGYCSSSDNALHRACMEDCYPCESACNTAREACWQGCADAACCQGCGSSNDECNDACDASDAGSTGGSQCLVDCDLQYPRGARTEIDLILCAEDNCLEPCNWCPNGP